MKNRKLLALLTVVALTLTMLAPAALADTIKIGGLAPLTGEVAQYGIAVREGVDLYIEQLNAAGGIDGNNVEVIWFDEMGDATKAVNGFNQLVDNDGVVAIIGDVTSTPSLAVGDRAKEYGIPMITASATNYDVTTDKPFYFRSCFLDPFQASVMANYAKSSYSAAKVAVLYDASDDYNTGLAEAFKAQAEKNGMEVVAYEAGTGADVDFKAQLTNIASKSPDVLYLPFYYGPAALIIKQAKEVGLEVPVLGADGMGSVETVIDDVALLTNVVYTDHFTADAQSDVVKAFFSGYEAKYGKAPTSAFNATGYDAALILCEGIKAAGGAENYTNVVAAIKAGKFEGVTGTIVFDEHNDPIKSAYIMSYKEDGTKYLKESVAP